MGGRAALTDEAWPYGQPEIGQTAERSRRIDAGDIERFAELSGDRNPIHFDSVAAGHTEFGEIVVQGSITTAILNAVVSEDLPGPGSVFMSVNWNFTAPVRPGDTITGRVEVTKVRRDKPVTELATTAVRDDGVLVLEGSAVCYTFPLNASTEN